MTDLRTPPAPSEATDRAHKTASEDDVFAAADKATLDNDLERATALYKKIPATSQRRFVALVNLSQLQLRMGHRHEAEESALAALKLAETTEPRYPVSHVHAFRLLGQCKGDGVHCSIAEKIFLQAIACADNWSKKIVGARDDGSMERKIAALLLDDIILEKANVYNSIGGMWILADEPNLAIRSLEQSRKLHKESINGGGVGFAEVLTNLAQALMQTNQPLNAFLALDEAFDIATRTGNKPQLRRVETARYILRSQDASDLVQPLPRMLEEAAEEAERSSEFPTAYLRWIIAAKEAAIYGNREAAEAALASAARLEPKCPPDDPCLPMRSYIDALLKIESGRDGAAINVLLEGAKKWTDLLRGLVSTFDIEQLTRRLHNHFTLLSRLLLDRDRREESLCAFELGRGLAHALELHKSSFDSIGRFYGFEDRQVSVELLAEARGTISDNEALAVFAILDGELVAFVVTSQRIDTLREPLGNEAQIVSFMRQLVELPAALSSQEGAAAIPEPIVKLVERVAVALLAKHLTGISPHGELHVIPWRMCLRAAGLTWDQLSTATELGIISRVLSKGKAVPVPSHSVTLGFGVVDTREGGRLEFADESIDFYSIWGESRSSMDTAMLNALRAALRSESVVHVSCHGLGTAEALRLSLADGDFTVEEITEGQPIVAPIVLLSACSSGTYSVRLGDYPRGLAPAMLRAGARACVASRFPMSARFAARLFPKLSARLSRGEALRESFAKAIEELEPDADMWSDLACVELLTW